jgi:hypothetical protein
MEEGFLFYFTCTNVAHSICQFIINLYEYSKLENKTKIFFSATIKEMPFLYKLAKLLLKDTNVENIIQENVIYNFKKLYIPTYIWFTDIINLEPLKDIINNVRIYTCNNNFYESYGENKNAFIYFDILIDKIYEQVKDNYTKYDNICLIKSNLCTDSTTPDRAIIVNEKINDYIKNQNYILLFPHKINDIIEFIVQLKSAKEIITSYGGANCVNRFFFNKNATVKVICNMSYYDEYKYIWHNCVSIYSVKKYIFFLDIQDKITLESLEKIINYNI